MNAIEAAVDEGVLTVTLNRPDKKNAITADMYARLAATFREASRDESVRCVLLKGAGADFTSGNDVSLFVQSDSAPKDSPATEFMQEVVRFAKPVVACVRGYAVGIGATVLIHCDYIVLAEDAKIRFPFVDLGLCPEFGSTLLLRELVGRRRADEWLMLGTTINANAALDAGFANAVTSASDIEQASLDVARRFVAKPATALKATRKLLRAVHVEDAMQRVAIEGSVLDELRRSDEAQAIFRKFLKK